MTSRISPAEWKVMELLWQKPYTLMQMVSELGESEAWAKSTVTTLVKRLEQKGMIGSQANGRTKSFYPLAKREEVVAEQTESFLQRAYHGSLGCMVSAMAERNDLKQEDIDELYTILQKAEEGLK